MQDLDVVGEFWRADNPERRVPGRLTFNMASGGSLQLAGAFTEDPRQRSSDTSDFVSVRIYGKAGYIKYTLFHCLKIAWRANAEIVYREDYSIVFVLSGSYLVEDDDPEFTSSGVRFQHLDSWVAHPTITDDHEWCENRIKRYHLSFEPRAPISVHTCIGNLTLMHSDNVQWHTAPYKAEISSQCSFGFQFDRPVALERILRVSAALQYLLTIGADCPTPATALWLRHSERDTEASADGSVSRLMNLFIRWYGSESSREDDDTLRYSMLFTFEQLGGIEAIARWFDVYEKYGAVVDIVMSSWFQPILFDMNRFFNAVTAAEALARIRVQKQNINFRDELTHLCELAGDEFTQLVGDVDSWVGRVIKLRINKVVHPGIWDDSTLWPTDLHWISESIYCLVIICLLRIMDIPNDVVARFPTHRRFREVSYHTQMATGKIPSWSPKFGNRFLN